MKFCLIYPGTFSGLVSLQSVLLESHQEAQAARALEIAERKKLGVPLDDATDFAAVWPLVTEMGALPRENGKAYADLALKIHALTAGHTLVPLNPYEPVDGYDDVMLKFRALSECDLQDHMLAVGSAHRDVEAAQAAPIEKRASLVRFASEKRDQAFLDFIADSVAHVVIGDQKTNDDVMASADLEAIRATGLMVPIYLAARDYQRLSPGKGSRFGSPLLST